MSLTSTRDLPRPSPLARHWRHDPNTVYLNHGSFGAVPTEVSAAQDRYQSLMEADAVLFFVTQLERLLDASRRQLASFLRCAESDLVFVPNATVAVATVLHNLRLKPGDEILVSQHEYPACMNALRQAATQWGATIVTAPMPFPIRSADEVAASILSRVTPKTRLAMFSHVTSPSAVILPLATIVPELERKGVRVLVDGAHMPGFAPTLDLGAMRPSYYTANCHKWLCSPKGTAFLYVREDVRNTAGPHAASGTNYFRPLALSNSAERTKPGRSDFHKEFDYVGTQDFTNWCALGDAISFLPTIVGESAGDQAAIARGWATIMRMNHDLCLKGRDLICRTLGVEPPVPDEMLGSMSTILLPAASRERSRQLAARPSRFHDALQDALLEKHRIQVPIWNIPANADDASATWPLPGGAWGKRTLRISAQLYNSLEQFEYLAACLKKELAAEGL